MPLPALLLVLLAPAAQADSSAPITIRGHQWAPFISPMGEPFRARTADDDTLADWFRQADRNHDGQLTAEEMIADANRFFASLDSNQDGQIDPDELRTYEYEVAPDIQVNSRTERAPGQHGPVVRQSDDDLLQDPDRHHDRRDRSNEIASSLGLGGALQGAARYGLLNMPEPVAAADADFDRAISLQEFRQAALARFQLLDRAHRGSVTLAQLEALRPASPDEKHRFKLKDDSPDARIGNSLPPGP